jgi:hypothetical protein
MSNKLEIYKNYHDRVGWEFYISRTPGRYVNVYMLHLRFGGVMCGGWLMQRCSYLPPEATLSSPLDFLVITGATIEGVWKKGSRIRGFGTHFIEKEPNEEL